MDYDTPQSLFKKYKKAAGEDDFEALIDKGSKIILYATQWCKSQIEDSWIGFGTTIEKMAGQQVNSIFKDADESDKMALISLLHNLFRAQTANTKAWFAIGYISEITHILRRVAVEIKYQDLTSSKNWELTWDETADLVSEFLRKCISEISFAAENYSPKKLVPFSFLEPERSEYRGKDLDINALHEWAQKIFDRACDEKIPKLDARKAAFLA